MENDLPIIKLSNSEKKWLEKVYEIVSTGALHKNNHRMIMYEIRNDIELTFSPDSIDKRLHYELNDKYHITLLGMLHVYPDNPYIKYCDQTIKFILEKIINLPSNISIEAIEISEALNIEVKDVVLVFDLISPLGSFWSGKSQLGIDSAQIQFGRKENYNAYINYPGIEKLLINFFVTRNFDGSPNLNNNILKGNKMKYKIFLSHSSKDSDLANDFMDYMKVSMDIPGSEIYNTSNGSISTGENFNKDIKENITNSSLVVLLITKNYFESFFCMIEMGAAWALDKKIYPIILAPVTFDDLDKKTPFVKPQAIKLNNENDLRKMADEFSQKHKIIGHFDSNVLNRHIKKFIENVNNYKFEFIRIITNDTNLSSNDIRILHDLSNIFPSSLVFDILGYIKSGLHYKSKAFFEENNLDRLKYIDFEFDNFKLENLKINFINSLLKIQNYIQRDNTIINREEISNIEASWNELYRYVKNNAPQFTWKKEVDIFPL